jgi:hypothetical protein
LSEKPRTQERTAFDVRVGNGARLGFVVMLPDDVVRVGHPWVAFTFDAPNDHVTPLGRYRNARLAVSAILVAAGEV